MSLLADVLSGDDVHGGVAGLLRLGPILPVMLAGAVAALQRVRPVLSTRRAACVVASATAGAIHVGLVPSHFARSPAVGVLFVVAGAAQLVLATGVGVSPHRWWWPRVFVLTAVASPVTYVGSRTTVLPVFGRPERLDALGVITTTLTVLAALCWFSTGRVSSWIAEDRVAAGAVIMGALLAPVVFGLDASLANTAIVVVIGSALATFGGVGRRRMCWVVADAAVLALLVRGPVRGFLLIGAAVGIAHAFKADRVFRWLPTNALALVVTLSIRPLDLRLNLLHVGHPSDVGGAVGLFVLAGLVSVAAVARHRIGGIVAAYGALTIVELGRVWQGATGSGSIEVFGTSLTLFVLVATALLDNDPAAGDSVGVLQGAAVGLAVGGSLAIGVAYPTPSGVLAGGVAAAIAMAWRGRPRRAERGRTGHASPAKLRGT